jgi:hypothetical protein
MHNKLEKLMIILLGVDICSVDTFWEVGSNSATAAKMHDFTADAMVPSSMRDLILSSALTSPSSNLKISK